MYHVTRASNTKSILTYGLEPQLGERALECGESLPAVFAFPTLQDCHTALNQWLGEWWWAKEEIEGADIPLVIIEFDPTGLARLPKQVAYEERFASVVPPTSLRALHSQDAFEKLTLSFLMADVA
jgi:hypothetical protein